MHTMGATWVATPNTRQHDAYYQRQYVEGLTRSGTGPNTLEPASPAPPPLPPATINKICNEINKLTQTLRADRKSSALNRTETHLFSVHELTNVRPGTGSVAVATGKREPIAEIGDLGALKNVRRVNSFTRTLVSVRDLVEQFHRVIFDADGVSVESPDGGIRTLIGRPMRNRLYSYDGDALSRHAVAVRVC